MSAAVWMLAAAIAAEPTPDISVDPSTPTAEVDGPAARDAHDDVLTTPIAESTVSEMAPADIASTLRSLQAELAAQRAEIAALRAAPKPPLQDTGEPGAAPLRVPEGAEIDEVVGFGQDVFVRGVVHGDVTSFGGDVHVFPSGRVDGHAVAVGGVVRVDEGGVVHGDRVGLGGDDWRGIEGEHRRRGVWAGLVRRLIFFLSFAGAGVLVLGLFPDRVTRVSRRITKRPARSFLTGMFGAVGLVLGALVFAVTIIGLPISVLLAALFGMAWLLGFVGLCQAMGDRLPLENRVHGRWLAFLVGSTLMTLFGLLPWVGIITLVLTSLLGMGAAMATRLGSRT